MKYLYKLMHVIYKNKCVLFYMFTDVSNTKINIARL